MRQPFQRWRQPLSLSHGGILQLLAPPLPRPRPEADVTCYVLTRARAAARPVLRGRRLRPVEAAGRRPRSARRIRSGLGAAQRRS